MSTPKLKYYEMPPK